jgi:hypothetical protein
VAAAGMPGVQFFLSESPWEAEQINGRRLELLREEPATAPHDGGVIVIDDSGDRKDGTATAHVGRQWLGRLGKTDNGIVTRGPDERVRRPPAERDLATARLHHRGHHPPRRPNWPTVVEGEPVDEYHTATGLTLAAEALTALRSAGLPVRLRVGTVRRPFARAGDQCRRRLARHVPGAVHRRAHPAHHRHHRRPALRVRRASHLRPRRRRGHLGHRGADVGAGHPGARRRPTDRPRRTRPRSGMAGQARRSPTMLCFLPSRKAVSPAVPSASLSRRTSRSASWSAGTADPVPPARPPGGQSEGPPGLGVGRGALGHSG